ncbi:MAG: DUF86 domain-containing protein [Nanoarchaeota archaeon]|nr:DUF86 domain-containing protein [Nanoarchaeota archaeon]
MNERISDKIREIEEHLEQLEEIKPDYLKDYIQDFKIRAACERLTEKIIEGIVDLAFLIIKEKNFDSPENDLETFDILLENKIIQEKLAKKLQDAKRMRNILAHEYGKVNDEIIFYSIKEELGNDVMDFIRAIKVIL